MKALRLLALSLALVFGAGCASLGSADGSLIQRVLDRTLPPTFEGPAHVEHKNVWIDFSIDATGLRRDAKGWTWKTLTYRRNGRTSHGAITLGTP